MKYDDYYQMILAHAQVLDQNAKDKSHRQRKANSNSKSNGGKASSNKSSNKPNTLPKTPENNFLDKKVWK